MLSHIEELLDETLQTEMPNVEGEDSNRGNP